MSVRLHTVCSFVCGLQGRHGWPQFRSDWPQLGWICDILRTVSPKCTWTDHRKSQICPNLTELGTTADIRGGLCDVVTSASGVPIEVLIPTQWKDSRNVNWANNWTTLTPNDANVRLNKTHLVRQTKNKVTECRTRDICPLSDYLVYFWPGLPAVKERQVVLDACNLSIFSLPAHFIVHAVFLNYSIQIPALQMLPLPFAI